MTRTSEPQRAIPARLRGAGRHDGRPAGDLGTDAAASAQPGAAYRIQSKPSAASDRIAPSDYSAYPASLSPVHVQFLPWVVMIWLGGALVFWRGSPEPG